MAQLSRRRNRRRLLIALLFVLLVVAASLARFYTDVLWFGEVGFKDVLFVTLRTQLMLGLAVGLLVGGLAWINLVVAARGAPAYRPSARLGLTGENPIDRYWDAVGPYLKWLRLGAAGLIGLLAAFGASTGWQTFLLWSNRVSFGTKDPQFDRDIGFYVFELPFLNNVLDYLWLAVFVSLLLSLVAHYFYGTIRPEAGLSGISAGALAHVSVLLGVLALIKAAQYWLGRYSLNFSPRGVVTGASYTDVHSQLPALTLLTIISVISATIFLVNIRVRRATLPIAAIAIWILTAVLAGGLWPLVVQKFSVDPQEIQRERPFIQRNIAGTREAFGLSDVVTSPFLASQDLTPDDIEANETLLSNVRLWDPPVLRRALLQLQAIRTYYDFPDVDVDRYQIDGQTRQVLLSARELSTENLEEKSRTWSNLHLHYTHGYGIVATLANQTTPTGQPQFLVKDVPGTYSPGAEALRSIQPRVYFGEAFSPAEYSVVNSKQEELDYSTEEGVQRSRYEGTGGVLVGGLFRRIAFAIREGDPNLLLSSLITNDSKILIYRNVRDRVRRAAPFLALDNDPYIANVDGRLEWIIDAYTTTPYYPYSQRVDMDSLVADGKGSLEGRQNYIRNSVKVVVDAYDGSMRFYIVDEEDPIVAAWSKVFPSLFSDDPPSDELRAHFRYPEDLFKVQSDVYRTYHMTDAVEFYGKEDAWSIPQNPLDPGPNEDTADVIPDELQPTYLLVRLPGDTSDRFLLTRPFTPRNRDNMISFFVARSDPEDYGQLETIQFPRQRVILGPIQVDNLINQDVQISRNLTLLGQSGSQVTFGSLVVLPIEDSILYVQPLFVTAERVGNPELKRVIVVYGNETAMGTTFEDALAEIFGALGAATPEEPAEEFGEQTGRKEEGPQDPAPARVSALVRRAAQLYDRAQSALENRDLATYGRLVERLGRVLRQAEAASS